MSEIAVTELEPGTFGVEVDEGHQTTGHRVHVPEEFVEQAGLSDTAPEELVRATFAFLLEQEPATSILPEFGLDDVPRYYPIFVGELRRRLA